MPRKPIVFMALQNYCILFYRTVVCNWVHISLAVLTLSMLGKMSADDIGLFFFFFFFPNTGFGISCRLSPKETICMTCQSLFCAKNRKISSFCRLLNFTHTMVKVK